MENEVKDVPITEYPTILFYPKNQAHFIKYTGKHTVEDIWKFMADHEVALARSEL